MDYFLAVQICIQYMDADYNIHIQYKVRSMVTHRTSFARFPVTRGMIIYGATSCVIKYIKCKFHVFSFIILAADQSKVPVYITIAVCMYFEYNHLLPCIHYHTTSLCVCDQCVV